LVSWHVDGGKLAIARAPVVLQFSAENRWLNRDKTVLAYRPESR
jgi:hypothetical protein